MALAWLVEAREIAPLILVDVVDLFSFLVIRKLATCHHDVVVLDQTHVVLNVSFIRTFARDRLESIWILAASADFEAVLLMLDNDFVSRHSNIVVHTRRTIILEVHAVIGLIIHVEEARFVCSSCDVMLFYATSSF